MQIEKFIQLRELGKSLDDIQSEYFLTSSSLYTLELSFLAYSKSVPLSVMMDIVNRLKKYKHYKGAEYWSLGDFKHTENDEVFVSYLDKDSVGWARPKQMFNGFAGDVPRFTEILLEKEKKEKE